MLQLKVVSHLNKSQLIEKMNIQKDIRLFQYWQIVYIVYNNPGKKSEEYASLLGINKEKVYRIIQTYNKKGVLFDKDLKWGGRREERSLITFKEESELMERIAIKARKGKVLTANDIRKEVEEKIGKKVSDDYLWDLFKRHNWKKKAPRPEHPNKNKKLQDDFKKNSPPFWVPASNY